MQNALVSCKKEDLVDADEACEIHSISILKPWNEWHQNLYVRTKISSWKEKPREDYHLLNLYYSSPSTVESLSP